MEEAAELGAKESQATGWENEHLALFFGTWGFFLASTLFPVWHLPAVALNSGEEAIGPDRVLSLCGGSLLIP